MIGFWLLLIILIAIGIVYIRSTLNNKKSAAAKSAAKREAFVNQEVVVDEKGKVVSTSTTPEIVTATNGGTGKCEPKDNRLINRTCRVKARNVCKAVRPKFLSGARRSCKRKERTRCFAQEQARRCSPSQASALVQAFSFN